MLSKGREFMDIADLVKKYYSLDDLPEIEERILTHPSRLDRFPGPRNEKGYRSDPFDRRGDFNIAFLGCGWVEGSGVEYPDIFTNKVKAKLQAETGLKVVSWNLGQGSMGMDHLVRIAPAVCNVLHPDLIVVIGTWANRSEHFTAEGKRIALYQPIAKLVRNGHLDDSESDRELANAFDALSSDYQDLSSHIQNINSLNGIFDAANIPWVLSWIDRPEVAGSMATMQEAGLLPKGRFLGSIFAQIDDANSTDDHPGPRSHKTFAEVVAGWIKQSDLLATGGISKPRPLKRWARKTMSKWRTRREPIGHVEDDDDDIYPLW